MQGSQSHEPEVGESLETIMHALLNELHVALPGKIEKYTAATQLADVTPTMLRVYLDEDGVTEITVPYPVITDVPVHFPRGGGAFLSLPMKAGDLVMLVFAQRSLDAWLETDGKTAVDHKDARRHHISDAFAIAGISTTKNKIPNAHATDIVIGLEDGSGEFHIMPGGNTYFKSPKVMLGSSGAAAALAVSSVTDARLNALESFANTHFHSNGNFGSPTGPAISPMSPGGGTTASSKVFADA